MVPIADPGLVLETYGRSAFAGKACLVTGAASGMGRAIARRLAEAGAHVVLGDIQADALAAATEAIRAADVAIDPVGIEVDLSDQAECESFVEQAVRAAARLDVVVNAAGIGGMIGTVETHSIDDWRRALDTNLGSVFAVSRAAVPHLRATGGGSIVNFASPAAYRGSPKMPSHAYAASKGAVIALTKVMAASFGADGIRVNAVVPGLVRTAMTEGLLQANDGVDGEGGGRPIGRIGEPDDAAGCVLFLASRAAAYVTGVTLVMDGGAGVTR